MIPLQAITLGVLAGGRASRMGGADKAWLDAGGRSLLETCLDGFPPGFAARLVSARTADGRHDQLGVQAVLDLRPGFAGPVAGLEALAGACRSPWLLTVPVDAVVLPPVILDRLRDAAGIRGACVHDRDGLQPLVALWPAAALRDAARFSLDSGKAAAHDLVAKLGLAPVDIGPLRLRNLNTPESLREPLQ